VQFAKETQLSIEEARQLLDEKAKEFNATFDTDEKGGISYYFNP
jgi:large subunit ribosomal protein L7/L12